eukprot:TRINITY_DN51522_c0_g1_i1.p1 TRINITY_DN51522_c0_g1~~TRINITY_DN51522_c0_g1_i1.p1  ORF type:complete len:425 (+),score=99.54 TRINITY_DN51522_c0_g1_i1:121-1395(+)
MVLAWGCLTRRHLPTCLGTLCRHGSLSGVDATRRLCIQAQPTTRMYHFVPAPASTPATSSSSRSPSCYGMRSEVKPALQLGSVRFFAAKRNKRSNRLMKGVVGRALKVAPPPKRMSKRALQQYVDHLAAHGGDAAKQIVSKAREEKALAEKKEESWQLTSEEKTALVAKYLPEELETMKTRRRVNHKWLWRWLRRADWKRFDACLEKLKADGVPYDEVTYNLAIYSNLLNRWKEDRDAWQAIEEMEAERKFHPTLIRMQKGFLETYFDLKEVDAAPSWQNIQRVTHTFWHISVNFKRRRVKELRRRLSEAAAEQRRLQQSGGDPEQIQAASSAAGAPMQLLVDGRDSSAYGNPAAAQLEDPRDEEELWSDGEEDDNAVRRSYLPRKRPRRLHGIFRGSGVPRQKQQRERVRHAHRVGRALYSDR